MKKLSRSLGKVLLGGATNFMECWRMKVLVFGKSGVYRVRRILSARMLSGTSTEGWRQIAMLGETIERLDKESIRAKSSRVRNVYYYRTVRLGR